MPKKEVLRHYTMTLNESFHGLTEDMQREKAKIKREIHAYETKLSNARKLIVSGDIDKDDFKHLKAEYVDSIAKLEKSWLQHKPKP